jgi:YHS domain-containing protein
MAQCPVCGREVDPNQTTAAVGRTVGGAPESNPEFGTRRFHNGKWYTLDTLDCRSKFMANPDQYVKEST